MPYLSINYSLNNRLTYSSAITNTLLDALSTHNNYQLYFTIRNNMYIDCCNCQSKNRQLHIPYLSHIQQIYYVLYTLKQQTKLIIAMKEQEDILKYVLIISTFYDKAITNHPKKQSLKRSIQNWKQDIHAYFSKTQDQQTKTVRTLATNFDRKSSPNKYPTPKPIESTLPEFTVFSLKEDNDFFKVFSYQYLVTMTASSTSQEIEALQEEISKAGHLLEGTSFAQSVTLRKISLLVNYLAKISESNSVQEIRGKIEIVYNEDKNILAKIVKVLALSRKPSLANLLSESPFSETAMKALCQVLNTRITLFEIGDNQNKRVLGKGPLELAMAVEKGTNSFHCLFRKSSPSVSRSNSKRTNETVDKAHLFTELLDKIHSNSEKLSMLKGLSKSEAIQDINIKERLKKATQRKL